VTTILVTGGCGYFGALLVAELQRRDHKVRVLDISNDVPADVEFVHADIRDRQAVLDACEGVDIVFHNVAQVPLARDRELIASVNVGGMANLLEACEDRTVAKVVATSSSAIFGVPATNPVRPDTPPNPAEAYGHAKLAAEHLCRAAVTRGVDVTIIRPRTILGHGRLGIFALLFDWIADGVDVFVLGRGDNRYQFVHAEDLADACIRAGDRAGAAVYNIGAQQFGTMREALEGLCRHAGTGSRVRNLPAGPTAAVMRATAAARVSPFAPYHWLMYGRSMWFDTSTAEHDLGWSARFSNEQMLTESYDWFVTHRDELAHAAGSHHRRPVRQGVLRLAKRVMHAHVR
jgi:nucleoside-diphosphate-sugar epimerase